MSTTQTDRIAGLVAQGERVVVLTGAGISTPSGIPDFRSPHVGLWQRVDPGVVASIEGFRRDPEGFYAWLRPLVQKIMLAEPNPAHRALAALERAGRVHTIVTQNIDGLHQKAGSRHVLELHGHLRQATCQRCHRQVPTVRLIDAFLARGEVPRCPQCTGILKPDIVLFGELLPAGVLQQAEDEARKCDLMWVVGSSLTVAPASLLPRIALGHGARLIVMNRTATDFDGFADVVLRGDVAEVLPTVAAAVVP